MGSQDFLDAVTDAKVGAVHMTSNDEQYSNRQVVMRHIRQPKRFGLGMEAT